jgi:SMC interacting uncharacterized protein involved in chromosome segregation
MNPWLLSDSPTVATLNARGELRRLRMLVDPAVRFPGTEDEYVSALRAEIDRLEDVLSDVLHVGDELPGYVPEGVVAEQYVLKEDFDALGTERDELEEKHDALARENDDLEDKLREREAALAADPDEAKQQLEYALKQVRALEAEAKKRAASPADKRALDAVYRCNPGRRSKPKLEMYEKIRNAVEEALK